MRRALVFLTPFGSPLAPNEYTLAWFPLVGALLGLAVGALWWLAAKAWPPLPSAAVAIAADLVLTGLLHFDGLADAGDGLLAPMTKERRLEAMADAAVGAFGVIAVSVVLLLRFSAFAVLRPVPLAVAGLWCASRTTMVAMTEFLPYARPTGLVKNFLAGESRTSRQRYVLRSSVILGLALSVMLVILGRGTRGLGALGAELVAMALVCALSWRRIGGYTGDVLGAAGVVGETIGLLV
ncbi:MAG: adenosylcobinamide-GDP ribazoletransferase, partial [Acidimicrobiales bacterium]